MRFLRRAAPTGGAAPSPDPVIALALRGRVDDADALEAAWSAGVGASDVGVRQATLAAAPAVSRALRPRSPDAAVRVAEQALPLLDDPAAGAVLRQVLATVRLDRGDVPTSEELLGIAHGLTAASDSLFDAGERVEALDRVHLALELLLHRTLHADVERSPLLEDPEAWIGEVRRSSAYSWVHGGGARSDRRRPVGRLLLLTKSGSHFAGLPARLAESLGVEVRTHALGDFEPAWPVPHSWRMSAQRARAREGIAPPVPDQARDALAWADQVLVDWCDEAAVAVASALPDDGPELVVRLHSVESLSVPPHFVDWRRVDRLVVVSDHLAAVTRAVLPQTSDVPTVVLPPYAVPADVLDRSADGDPESERTIAVVGWAQPVKDPIWALDLLARLREVDPSWRLLLVGPWFVEGAGRVGERAYADRFHERAAQADVEGAVDHEPWLDDVTRLRSRARVVVSSSVRESFGVGLHEAVAGGCLPVVRRWPMMAAYGAPSSAAAPEWVVDDVEQAAARILSSGDGDVSAARAWLRREVVERVVTDYAEALGWVPR